MNHTRSHRTEPVDEALAMDGVETAIDLGQEGRPETELGRLVVAARQEFLLAERRFLDRDDLEREVADRRGVSADREA